MKKLPLAEEMAKATEIKKPQQQVAVLHMQHQQKKYKVTELKDEAERRKRKDPHQISKKLKS